MSGPVECRPWPCSPSCGPVLHSQTLSLLPMSSVPVPEKYDSDKFVLPGPRFKSSLLLCAPDHTCAAPRPLAPPTALHAARTALDCQHTACHANLSRARPPEMAARDPGGGSGRDHATPPGPFPLAAHTAYVPSASLDSRSRLSPHLPCATGDDPSAMTPSGCESPSEGPRRSPSCPTEHPRGDVCCAQMLCANAFEHDPPHTPRARNNPTPAP